MIGQYIETVKILFVLYHLAVQLIALVPAVRRQFHIPFRIDFTQRGVSRFRHLLEFFRSICPESRVSVVRLVPELEDIHEIFIMVVKFLYVVAQYRNIFRSQP